MTAPGAHTTEARFDFIDWMKATGMLLIVYGHAGGHAILGNPVAPFNLKQIGVAFFVFVLGYGLARETRPVPRVLFSRLFEMYLMGIAAALLMSAIALVRIGDLNESNYLPFMLGANVAFDAFPANQTTWYIGTYLHLLLLWAVALRHRSISPLLLLAVLAGEVLLRAVLMEAAGNFVAYQLLSNWLSVLLLGMLAGQMRLGEPPSTRGTRTTAAVVAALALIGLTALWPDLARTLGIGQTNPFGRVEHEHIAVSALLTSSLVSLLYLLWTGLFFLLARGLPASGLVRFLAANTLIVFILHMPAIEFVNPLMSPLYSSDLVREHQWIRLGLNILMYFVALAALSECIRRALAPQRLRAGMWARLPARLRGATQPG